MLQTAAFATSHGGPKLRRRGFLASLPWLAFRAGATPAYDLRDGLTPRRVVNAMWDYSWLKSHYPGGPFADWDRVTDELKERGFNTVRLDCFPLVIGAMQSRDQEVTIAAEPLANWGFSDRDRPHRLMRELLEFAGVLKRKGLFAILSTWNNASIEYPDVKERLAKDRDAFRRSWERTLDLLGEHDLLSHVLYVDLDQEFPYFSAYAPELNGLRAGEGEPKQFEQGLTRMAWNAAQMEYVRKLFSEMLPHFQARYPQLRFTYSLTAFFKEVRSLGLELFDVLELHLWIHSPRFDNRSGFDAITKDRAAREYKDYGRRLEATLRSVRPMLLKEMHNRMAFARAWGEEIAAPIVVTEAWGPWWHMDSPDLSWEWLKQWCAECMDLAGKYGFWGATPWNYCHPYWKNWQDVAWYRKVNSAFLGS